ncbi:unnamed protein product, partial [marine sediment metagenome]
PGKWAHYSGTGVCGMKGCKCLKYRPVKRSNYPIYDEKTDEVYKP